MACNCENQTDSKLEEADIVVLLSKYLNPLDSLLRCQICFEYFDTSMITKCSHNYCSFCIRRYMQYKCQCPICFQVASEPELRNNRLLDEILRVYKSLRNTLSAACKSYKKETLQDKAAVASTILDNSVFPQGGKSTTVENVRDKTDTINEIPADNGSNEVSCPVCYKTISEDKINIHLDYCLKEKANEDTSQRKTLPKLVYHLLSEKEIRKKLKQHGLSIAGNKQSLIKRHKNFLALYNANCDALNPKPVSEIIREIECQELEERLNEQPKTVQVNKKSDPALIKKEHESYVKLHQSQFNGLINDIHQREIRQNVIKQELEEYVCNEVSSKNDSEQNEKFDLPPVVQATKLKDPSIIDVKEAPLSPVNTTGEQSFPSSAIHRKDNFLTDSSSPPSSLDDFEVGKTQLHTFRRRKRYRKNTQG